MANCNSCEVLFINGVKTHEHGCPESWKDYVRECKWCGAEFKPEGYYHICCSDSCDEAYNS